MTEEALLFGSSGPLVGILTRPAADADPAMPAVVLLDAGRTHRVGPNRLYVSIARRLAADGFAVCRFDFSGVGDSPARSEVQPLSAVVQDEIAEAMNHLHGRTGSRRFVLLGFCSGGSNAFITACHDERVSGVLAINSAYHLRGAGGELDSSALAAALRRHFLRLAFVSSFRQAIWRRLVTGRVDYGSLIRSLATGLIRTATRPKDHARAKPGTLVEDVRALTARGVRILHLYAEGDEGLDCFRLPRLQTRILERDPCSVEVIEGTNHTFATIWSQRELIERVSAWMKRFQGVGPA
jgi:dienelactone hydrolase